MTAKERTLSGEHSLSDERTLSDGRSIFTVLQDIVNNVQDIIRLEVRLAKTEVREELAKVQSAGLLLGIGATAAIFSVLFILLAIASALSRVVPDWAAALIVAADGIPSLLPEDDRTHSPRPLNPSERSR